MEDLQLLLKTLKKSPNRTYTQHTVSTKINLVDSLIKDICTTKDKETINLAFSIRDKIKELLIVKKEIKMSDFNLELTFKVMPEFKGNQEDLQAFLKIVKIINDSLKIEAKKTLIDFVVNVKLNSLARTAIGGTTVETYEILEQKLTERYRSPNTLAQIQFKLSRIQQNNDSIRVYSDKISKLIDQ